MYYPKSQIQTGFYSNNDLIEENSLKPYTGPYFQTSDGNYYSGKEPNEGKNIKLRIPGDSRARLLRYPNSLRYVNTQTPDPRFNRENIRYSILTDASRSDIPYSPTSYYPILTNNDIKNGEFTRYFVRKANQNQYTEVELNNISKIGDSKLYLPLQLQWVISGDKEEVRQINAKEVAYTEKILQTQGLGEFLRFNYLQFYQG